MNMSFSIIAYFSTSASWESVSILILDVTDQNLALPMRPAQTNWEHRLKKGMCMWCPLPCTQRASNLGRWALDSQRVMMDNVENWGSGMISFTLANAWMWPSLFIQVLNNNQYRSDMQTLSNFIYSSPNPQDIKIWLYGEKVFTDICLKWGHTLSPDRDWLVSLRRGNLSRCREDAMWKERHPSTSLGDPPQQAQEERKDALILNFQHAELGDNAIPTI